MEMRVGYRDAVSRAMEMEWGGLMLNVNAYMHRRHGLDAAWRCGALAPLRLQRSQSSSHMSLI